MKDQWYYLHKILYYKDVMFIIKCSAKKNHEFPTGFKPIIFRFLHYIASYCSVVDLLHFKLHPCDNIPAQFTLSTKARINYF